MIVIPYFIYRSSMNSIKAVATRSNMIIYQGFNIQLVVKMLWITSSNSSKFFFERLISSYLWGCGAYTLTTFKIFHHMLSLSEWCYLFFYMPLPQPWLIAHLRYSLFLICFEYANLYHFPFLQISFASFPNHLVSCRHKILILLFFITPTTKDFLVHNLMFYNAKLNQFLFFLSRMQSTPSSTVINRKLGHL